MSCYSSSGSHHSVSTDFTVHSGPSHLHSPLGHSDPNAHTHYIKPTPHFTTEYEDAYKGISEEVKDYKEPTMQAGDDWKQAEISLQKMIDAKFEVDMALQAMAQLHSRVLGEGIEVAYKHFDSMKECSMLSHELRDLIDTFQTCIRKIKT